MDHPVKEISGVIRTLASGSSEEQETTLNKYFLPNASFTHPFCRVPSISRGSIPFAHNVNSRWLILGIYRWYRILSPRIEIAVDSAAFDSASGLLYVTIRQTFSVWFIPFYKAPVRLVSVLRLAKRTPLLPDEVKSGQQKYYISSQEDLYQFNDCVQFLLPRLGPLLWFWWQIFSMLLCVFGSLIFLPLYILFNSSGNSK